MQLDVKRKMDKGDLVLFESHQLKHMTALRQVIFEKSL